MVCKISLRQRTHYTSSILCRRTEIGRRTKTVRRIKMLRFQIATKFGCVVVEVACADFKIVTNRRTHSVRCEKTPQSTQQRGETRRDRRSPNSPQLLR